MLNLLTKSVKLRKMLFRKKSLHVERPILFESIVNFSSRKKMIITPYAHSKTTKSGKYGLGYISLDSQAHSNNLCK